RACEGKISKRLGEFIGRSLHELFDDPNSKQVLTELLDQTNNRSDAGFEVMIPLGQSGLPEKSANSNTRQTAVYQQSPDQLVQAGATILWVYCQRLNHDRENSDILLTIRDITQRKVNEAGQEAFIAHVSHEMRSPLTNIRAYAETLLSDMVLDAGTQKEAFNVINEETSRLIRLVNDVLDLSNMETGTLSLDKGEVVLDRLVRQCANDVRAAAGSKKITLQSNYHPKLPKLLADREKLAVVINNLLSNAIKYTPNNGTVFVETNVDDRYVYIKITDTGYGIPEEDREKIFEKFYRIEREETAGIPGSGLGLATAREIAILHGGTINMTSELNKGTEMELKLPLTISGPVLGPAAGNSTPQSDE
ncbi:MAG: HAMP domain-containing histidine kinase, partial [Planctomycetes bacterium]|nr:HAMP domain-containing histidine kinase [Planctomycetota bacterium]